MDRNALGSIQLAGIVGAALTRFQDIPGLLERFREVYRTENGA